MNQIRALRQDITAQAKSSASQQTETAAPPPWSESAQRNEEQNPVLSDPTMDGTQEGEPELIGETAPAKEHKKFGT
jgi:hypothetical protein